MARRLYQSYVRPGFTVLDTDIILVQRDNTYLAFPVSAIGSGGGGITTPQVAGVFYAGPLTGSAALPAFRAIGATDIPNLDTAKITTGVFDIGRLSSDTPVAGEFLDASQTWSKASPFNPVFVAVSSNITATPGAIHLVNTGSGAINITLPVPSPLVDTAVWFADSNGFNPASPSGFGLNSLTLTAGSGQNIQGASTYVLSIENASLGLALKGTRWSIIQQTAPSLDLTTFEACVPVAVPQTISGVDFFSLLVDGDGNVVTFPRVSVPMYLHTQSVAASTWTVNHNLGRYPAIEIRSVGNVVVQADITHINVNQSQINFSAPYAGSAYCN